MKSEALSSNASSNKTNEPEHMTKKQRILEKITYDDLEDDDPNGKSIPLLNLSKVISCYFFLVICYFEFVSRLKDIYMVRCQVLLWNN